MMNKTLMQLLLVGSIALTGSTMAQNSQPASNIPKIIPPSNGGGH